MLRELLARLISWLRRLFRREEEYEPITTDFDADELIEDEEELYPEVAFDDFEEEWLEEEDEW